MYEVTYDATGITCEDVGSSGISDVQDGNPNALYSATSNFANYTDEVLSSAEPISFSLAYRVLSTNSMGTPSIGNITVAANCNFTNTTYHARTLFKDDSQITTVTVLKVNSALDTSAFNYTKRRQSNDDAVTYNGPYEVGDPPSNYLSIADAFIQLLNGAIQYVGGRLQLNDTNVGLTPLFDINELNQKWSFTANSHIQPSLAQGLQSLMANTTLSLMDLNIWNVTVKGWVDADYEVWDYDYELLWIIYGVAVLLTVVGAIIGLVCLQKNGAPSDRSMMQYMTRMRGPGMDRLFHGYDAEDSQAPADVQGVRLQYGKFNASLGGKQSGFMVAVAEELSL